MTAHQRLLLVAMTTCVATAWGQVGQRNPHIGYLYPAGGQRGAVFEITAGGQFIAGASQVHISGEGVRAKVIQYYRPVRNIQKEQREELQTRLKEVRDRRLAELSGKGPAPVPFPDKLDKKVADTFKATQKESTTPTKAPAQSTTPTKTAPFRPVEHPLLHNLENKSLRELQHVTHQIFFPPLKKQINAQIEETVLIEVTIAPDAAPGDRELRLETPQGLTNPMVFQVGQLPEICELEPNGPGERVGPVGPGGPVRPGGPVGPFAPGGRFEKAPPLDLPVLLNGQIMPGDVDRFRFRAKQGDPLVMEVHARRLIPYLADAVPGWFQATLALYDAEGNEVAFADDYRFNPDPVLFYKIPQDGEYELEIRDSIYRGREDFVYRIAVGNQPFITQAFPLGGRTGVKTVASVGGWNLTIAQLPLDTQAGDDCIRHTALRQNNWLSNPVAYAVDSLPDCVETEPNNTIRKGQPIVLPQIVNGRIALPGDIDVFRFKGRAGDQVVAEVFARRLNSPLDSLLRLTDASGRVLTWNDDYDEKDGDLRRGMGLLTHHADSYLMARLPKDGIYYVHLADSQHQGGEAYGYRLRMGPPQPDFALRATPSSVNIPPGGVVPLTIHALRKDGFGGDIELALKDAPAGCALSGGRIPAGRDRIRITLTAPQQPSGQPVVLRLEGRAQIAGQMVSRPVVPAEDMMQAFLWRHLTPSQELMVWVRKAPYRAPPAELADGGPVRIPAGGTAQVRIKTPKRPALRDVRLELSEPPKGVTLGDVTVVPDGLAFVLKADGDAAQAGFADNLIVEAFTETAGGRQGGKAAEQKRRVSLGVLPAIPFEIVQR